MNRQKWDSTSDIERMVAHLAEVLPRPLVALVVCELVEALARPPDIVCAWLERVRQWAVGQGAAPPADEAEALDVLTDRTGPGDPRRLAATVGYLPHRTDAAREAVALTLLMLASGAAPEPYQQAWAAAGALLAERLRGLVGWIGVSQVRLEPADDGLRTEDLLAVVRAGRLVSIGSRSRVTTIPDP